MWGFLGGVLGAGVLFGVHKVYSNYALLFTPLKKPVLYSLKISHYVEKARWSLDMLQVDYEERFSYPVLGLLLTGRTLPALQLSVTTTLGDSDDILNYFRGKHPRGNFLSVELSATEQKLLAEMDAFGKDVRRFLYGKLLKHSPHIVKRLWTAGTGLSAAFSDVVLYPVAKFLMVTLLKITPKGIERSQGQMEETLDKLDSLLADGREYLNGKQLSELDVVVCSLLAPLVLEPKYGGAKLPRMEELDSATRDAIAPYQDRPCARYCHALYARHR
mmetsp:Transcript_78941/g.118651  ORF Transcript_78941/g.118651 Transcript_78941/m.118651 type:complete len:274 (-) Transcript_78941:86-907(-)